MRLAKPRRAWARARVEAHDGCVHPGGPRRGALGTGPARKMDYSCFLFSDQIDVGSQLCVTSTYFCICMLVFVLETFHPRWRFPGDLWARGRQRQLF